MLFKCCARRLLHRPFRHYIQIHIYILVFHDFMYFYQQKSIEFWWILLYLFSTPVHFGMYWFTTSAVVHLIRNCLVWPVALYCTSHLSMPCCWCHYWCACFTSFGNIAMDGVTASTNVSAIAFAIAGCMCLIWRTAINSSWRVIPNTAPPPPAPRQHRACDCLVSTIYCVIAHKHTHINSRFVCSSNA